MTKKQQIAAAPKYGLYIETLGWLANQQNLSGVIFTQEKELAMSFAEGFDNPIMKLQTWNAALAFLLGSKDFKFECVYLS
jgi:hypothetical protein